MEDSFLTVEQASGLLPTDLTISEKRERSLYRTVGGQCIAVANSKLYNDYTFWYSCTVKYFEDHDVERICFITGMMGILLIPIKHMSEYIKHCGWKKQKKGLSFYIRIKYRENRFFLFCSEYPDIDVTEYFIAA